MRISKTRSDIDINPGKGIVTKRYRDRDTAAKEIYWYQQLDYGHPRLLDADIDQRVMVTEYHTPCTELPGYKPIRGLLKLLKQLESDRIHHRDVHIENVVQGIEGPLIIDWETGLEMNAPSYDLYGPDDSGVPAPDIHLRWPHYRMWLGSDHKKSLKTVWGIDDGCLPAHLDRRPRSQTG